MDIWVTLTYSLFVIAIFIGLVVCWRGELPKAQKLFWSSLIVVFPIAGTILYCFIAEDSKEYLQ